jgi:hypothetical protein
LRQKTQNRAHNVAARPAAAYAGAAEPYQPVMSDLLGLYP